MPQKRLSSIGLLLESERVPLEDDETDVDPDIFKPNWPRTPKCLQQELTGFLLVEHI